MNVLVTVIILGAFCAVHNISSIPGDNSHYVEGESRYIWMPDGEFKPILVDLDEPVNEIVLRASGSFNNTYWLYTRRNPINPQVIVHAYINSVKNSNYKRHHSLKVIVHGWKSNGRTLMNPLIISAFLAVQKCNVIVVDWSELAEQGYSTAVASVPSVGEQLGNFLTWLIDIYGGKWHRVHLVGFSLGAHVVDNAGRQTGSRVKKITGLDPAGPLWYGNCKALNRCNAQYVDVIHTDSHILGMFSPVGNADFYYNGGRNPQPGCITSLCSHGRATELFASTVRTNHLHARKCTSLWHAEFGICNGTYLPMGNAILEKRGDGIFGLQTDSNWPFLIIP